MRGFAHKIVSNARRISVAAPLRRDSQECCKIGCGAVISGRGIAETAWYPDPIVDYLPIPRANQLRS